MANTDINDKRLSSILDDSTFEEVVYTSSAVAVS
jgi:hypothetical protein